MKPKIFILEDNDGLREGLTALLEDRGFEVLAAESTKEADHLLADGGPVDLMILDQNLGQNSLSGAQYAMTLRDKEAYRNNPPECLIYSGETDAMYFRQAIELGVAGFLSKGEDLTEQMVPTVRALLLRRALKTTTFATIRKFITESPSLEPTMASLCENAILPQLKAHLGNPFFLVLESLEGTTVFDSIQNSAKMVCHANCDESGKGPTEWTELLKSIPPRQIKECSESEISLLCSEQAKPYPNKVVFIALYKSENTRLVLGFGEMERCAAYHHQDEIRSLASAFRTYFKPNIIEEHKNLLMCFSATTEGFLRGSAQAYSTAARKIQSLDEQLNSVKVLGKEFQHRGDVFKGIADQKSKEAVFLDSWKAVVDDLAQELGLEISLSHSGDDFPIQQPIRTGIYQLLAWMMGCPVGKGKSNRFSISGRLRKDFHYLNIHDSSIRYPTPARTQLLLKPNVPRDMKHSPEIISKLIEMPCLFEAKLRVENNGYFSDLSDNLLSEQGHHFQISLPQ